MTWQAASGQNYSSIHRLHIQLGWLEMAKIFILLLFDICVAWCFLFILESFREKKKTKTNNKLFDTELLQPSLERILANCYWRYLDPGLWPSPLWHRISHPSILLLPHLLSFCSPLAAQNWHSWGVIQRIEAYACLQLPFHLFSLGRSADSSLPAPGQFI